LRASGVTVSVVVPSAIGRRAAPWFGAPRLAEVPADRLAAAVSRGFLRRRAVIAAPGAATAALGALRRVPARLREAARGLLAAEVAASRQETDDAPLAGESGWGD